MLRYEVNKPRKEGFTMRRIYTELTGKIYSHNETCHSIAKKIGISASAMSAKMQGKSSFTVEEAAAIGKILSFAAADYYPCFILPIEIRK